MVTFGIGDLKDLKKRVLAAVRGKRGGPRIDFVSAELMFSIMTPKRWEIVRFMTGAGPMSIRELSRRVKRDVKGVHGDVHRLLMCGVLSKTDDGRVIFPFSGVHIDVMLKAAA